MLGQERGSAKKRALPGREWGQVSFGVACDVLGELSSAGNGESALELGVVVAYFLFSGAGGRVSFRVG